MKTMPFVESSSEQVEWVELSSELWSRPISHGVRFPRMSHVTGDEMQTPAALQAIVMLIVPQVVFSQAFVTPS